MRKLKKIRLEFCANCFFNSKSFNESHWRLVTSYASHTLLSICSQNTTDLRICFSVRFTVWYQQKWDFSTVKTTINHVVYRVSWTHQYAITTAKPASRILIQIVSTNSTSNCRNSPVERHLKSVQSDLSHAMITSPSIQDNHLLAHMLWLPDLCNVYQFLIYSLSHSLL